MHSVFKTLFLKNHILYLPMVLTAVRYCYGQECIVRLHILYELYKESENVCNFFQ